MTMFAEPFMLIALGVGLLTGALCAYLGNFLLLKNMAQIRDSTDLYIPWLDMTDRPGLEMAFGLGLVAHLAVIHLLGEHNRQTLVALGQKRWVRWVAYLLLALAILNLGVAKETPFVYLQF